MSQTVKLEFVEPDPNLVAEVVDNPAVPEIWIDGLAGVGFSGGTLKLVLFSERQTVHGNTDGAKPNHRAVVARITMSPVAANALVSTLQGAIAKFAEIGMVFPTISVEAGK